MDITDTKRQCTVLLFLVGEEVHNLFLKLSDNVGNSDFEKAVKSLVDHFLPKMRYSSSGLSCKGLTQMISSIPN